jgi:F-type H+-transporting ATPase subunit alpha
MILYAVTNGYLDEIPIEKVSAFEQAFYRFMETNHPEVGKSIKTENVITAEAEPNLKKAIAEFKQSAAY